MRKILSCLLSLAMGLAVATSAAAQTSTRLLEGDWTGEIKNAQGVVIATMSFELNRHEADTVHGEIEMIWTGQEEPLDADRFAARTDHQDRYDDLHIDFVVVTGGGIIAEISPYRNPQCGCAVSTSFTGTISGNRMEGSLRSQHRGSGLEEVGTWWVERR